MLRIASAIDRLNDAIGALIRWLLALMVLIGAFNAIARYLGRGTTLNLSSNAYIELQWYLFSLVFLLGAGYVLRHDAHVRVDLLYARLGPRARAAIDLLGTLLFLIPFSLLMIVTSYPAVRASWRVREMSPDPGGLPRYPIKAAILVGFALLILQGVAVLIRTVHTLRGHADGRSEPARTQPS